jgi:hypothetical protein
LYSKEQIALACPYCRQEIFRPLHWFKQTYFTCPACGGGLAAGQFETIVNELEQLFEASVERMVRGEPAKSCGGGQCGEKTDGACDG